MPKTCPRCGGEMVDDTLPGENRMTKCSECDYWCIEHRFAGRKSCVVGYYGWKPVSREWFVEQPDGTIVAVGHEEET